MSPNEIINLSRSVIQKEIEGISSLKDQIDERFAEAIDMLSKCKGHVLVTGAGTSNSIANRFAHLLSCCGTPALFIHPGDSQHGLSGAVTRKDVLVAISKGGETAEVNYLAKTSKNRKATVIAITENPNSTLGKLGDVALIVKSPPDVDPYGMIATGSSIINAALCDALCVVLLKLKGYTIKEFGETHPGGAVGKKLAGSRSN